MSAQRPQRVTVRAAAKINLHLGVGAPRADGFHPLSTVYQAIGLCDDVTAIAAEEWSLAFSTAGYLRAADLPVDGANLVTRAAAALAGHHGFTFGGPGGPGRGAAVSVEKAIPIAGGLAGGSADAAAALVALDRVWDLQTSDDDLLALAAGLGSDVPFALLGGSALGTGRGEVVEAVPDVATWWWVVVPSDAGLSTPKVYARFDELFPDAAATPPPADDVLAALAVGDVHALAASLHNDLQAAAVDLRPELGDLLDRGEQEGALRGLVSGSGPTCVFLCEGADHARDVAGGMMRTGSETVLVANGAVAGVHLVSDHV